MALLESPALSKSLRPSLAGLLVLLPLAAAAAGYRVQDLGGYYFAEDNAVNILRALPARALLFAQGDAVIFPLWYEQRVLGRRTDVAVVGNAVLPMDWVRQDLQRRYPDVLQPRVTGPIGAESVPRLVEVLVQMNADRRPIYTAYNKLDPPIQGWHLVPEGVVYRVARDAEGPVKDPEALPRARFQACVIRGYTRRPLDERTRKLVVGDYGIHHNGIGVAQEEAGRFESALAWYRQAARLDPESPEYPFNEGNALNALKRGAEAAEAYERAVAVDPTYSGGWYNLGVTRYNLGQRDAAIRAFMTVVKLDPQREDVKRLVKQIGGPAL